MHRPTCIGTALYSILALGMAMLVANAQGAEERVNPQRGSRDWSDLQSIEKLQWFSLDGRGPGTYEEYKAAHPTRPARLQVERVAPRLRGDRDSTKIALLVDEDLYPQIQSGLTTYLEDLNIAGYDVVVGTASGGTPAEIKAWIANQYYEAGCRGFLLIGGITAAWFEWERSATKTDVFPCDLYYMDLDGYWRDTNSDGIFDVHSVGDGDEAPEVYVARLYTPTLTWDTEANLVNHYFQKVRDYRRLAITVPWRGLEYVDEPWYWWSYSQDMIYGDDVVYHKIGQLTTGPDYLNRLAEGYQYIQVCAHSGSSAHGFGTYPTSSVAYAHVYVYSPVTHFAWLHLGANNGIKAWMNGVNVYTTIDLTDWTADQYKTSVILQEGWNRLMLKICQDGGDFCFSARLADSSGNPLDDLRYQLENPTTHGEFPCKNPYPHISQWLVNGLYANPDRETWLSTDYLGGEASVAPSPGDPVPEGEWDREYQVGTPVWLGEHFEWKYAPGGGATSEQIQDVDPPVFFYNLFACGSGRYTEEDYLGGSVILGTSYGLSSIASTKTGSMVNNFYFMGPLGDGATFGEAYHNWWTEQAPYDHDLRGWIYGIVLSGDPTLRPVYEFEDCNGNAKPDAYDIVDGVSADCNGNWIPDECDIASGYSQDADHDGVPDECGPALCAGDVNCDGLVDFDDIDPFVAALGCAGGDPGCWDSSCPWLNADCNGDSDVTFDDIDPFVARIGATCP